MSGSKNAAVAYLIRRYMRKGMAHHQAVAAALTTYAKSVAANKASR